jgi:putative ABC transport system ATP-binding protein
MSDHYPSKKQFNVQLFDILRPESGFYKAVIIYSIAISLLTLALPISLQLLVDTVANIALIRAVVLISIMLFGLLFLSSLMYALRAYAMELFTRKFYSRISSEIAMTAMLAEPDYFEEHHKTDLFNRYFDILTIKKSIPSILTNGFTLVLQSLIGFAVVSFYHFYFFIFCLILGLLIWLIWKIWGWAAINTAFRLSDAKYKTAAWLQSLSINVDAYRNSLNPSYVMNETDRLIDDHIDCQKKHFRNTYSQLLSFLLLYSLASAVLLGMGGWLVIVGELTLGQLVAAELIMSAIFAGLPQMAGYLDSFFDVCAAVEELSRFKEVKTEAAKKGKFQPMPANNGIEFAKVRLTRQEQESKFNFVLPQSSIIQVTGDPVSFRWLAEMLRANIKPYSGLITIGQVDNSDIDLISLRQSVRFIDRVTFLPMTVKDYLDLFIPENPIISRLQALTLMRLDEDIVRLKLGYETLLSRSAWPLTQPQATRLKLASVLLAMPSILVIGDIIDTVDPDVFEEFAAAMRKGNTTIIYYTRRQDVNCFDFQLKLEAAQQSITPVDKGSA